MSSVCLIGQTITTGDVTGAVMDPADAVLSGATVTIRNVATGENRTVTTNEAGLYRFTFLAPGNYALEAHTSGLATKSATIAVALGQVKTVNLITQLAQTSQSVEVSAHALVVETDNANLASTYSRKQMEGLPAPGGDITTIAFTAPGVVINTGSGYGNFSSHGLPATSNLFTTNGNDEMDPYLNLNNSGASNLLLGANEVEEAAIVQNAYSVQYGRQAGAQVNFITKGGTNEFHGNLFYQWNGDALNANDFFNNATGTPRSRAISNQYAASIGGRIKRDKTFFYLNTEGLRYVLPSAGVVAVPTPQLEQYTISQIAPSQTALYQQAFNLYNHAPGISRAVPVTNGGGQLQDNNGALGCGGLAGTPALGGGTFGVNTPCALVYGTTVSNQNTEWLMVARVDQIINDKQKIHFRYKDDHGLQPTSTSPISPLFNVQSSQPEHDGQMNYVYVISPRMVNNFIGAASWYINIFGPANFQKSLIAFPTDWLVNDGGSNGSFGLASLGTSYPTGRAVGQLHLTDDLSIISGNHTIKIGANYRYNRVTDTSPAFNIITGAYSFNSLQDLASGQLATSGFGSNFTQGFPLFDAAHIRLYSLGVYAQDEWAMGKSAKLTVGIRLDRNNNPVCTDNCFARLVQPFTSDAFDKNANIPYNQAIVTGQRTAFQSMELIVAQPRLGLVLTPFGPKNVVIRTGVGLFSDLAPGFLASNIFINSPNVFTPTILTGSVNTAAADAGSAQAIAIASSQAFQRGFASGQTLAQIVQGQGQTPFAPPTYYVGPNEVKNPKYLEWSFEIEQGVGTHDVLSLTYSGNHGYDLFLQDGRVNAFTDPATYPNGYGGLPSVAPDPRFQTVTQLANSAASNYDGLSVQYRHTFGYGLDGQFSYTWSHALDDVSNAGLGLPFNINDSLNFQANPYAVSHNYSNSDYDIRHSVTADFLWETPWKPAGPIGRLARGWTVGGKFYARTGTPFTVFNSHITGNLSNALGSGVVIADLLDPGVTRTCTSVNTPCFSSSQFATSETQFDWGNVPRNFFRAPGYFDVDTQVSKKFPIGEKASFALGASAYNLLNHPEFASPAHDTAIPGLGVIGSTVTPPTSPYGASAGAVVSGRVMVISGRVTF